MNLILLVSVLDDGVLDSAQLEDVSRLQYISLKLNYDYFLNTLGILQGTHNQIIVILWAVLVGLNEEVVYLMVHLTSLLDYICQWFQVRVFERFLSFLKADFILFEIILNHTISADSA